MKRQHFNYTDEKHKIRPEDESFFIDAALKNKGRVFFADLAAVAAP
ncbi:MAG: hypothetical protein AB1650_07685 [Candidatus Omnitrophota bacterium]